MPKSRLTLLCSGLAALFMSACTPEPSTNTGSGGKTGAATGGASGTASGGSTGAGTGGAPGTASGGNTGAGTGGASGGSTGAGTGGAAGTASGGSTGAGTGGRANSGGSTGAASGGATGSGGSTGTAGMGAGGARVDMAGIGLAKPGDMTNVTRKYLNLGDMRLINNRWGSDELGCAGTMQRVMINTDGSLGWEFNRPACGGAKEKPDYPEVEFGVAPFGPTNPLLTTPAFSSTTLLPKQIKDLTSASVTVNNMNITLQKPTIWNINFEVWLSERNPVTDPNPGVYAEIIAFWGWEDGRWACGATELSKPGLTAGTHSYKLCHQSDTWAGGKWRFYQFNVDSGPLRAYSGKADVKAFIDWVVTQYGISRDLWVTRIEVGSEIDDNTQGSVKVQNLTFEINGTQKKVELGQ